MEDVRTVAAELHRLAETDDPSPFDTAELLARGRRGRRRRQLFTAGGAVAGVAVIALVASLLPGSSLANNKPAVSGDGTRSSLFEPVPGVPSGEAGAGQSVSKEEATRRCALRYPENKQPLEGTGPFRSGHIVTYQVEIGGKKVLPCIVPGGDKPSAALVAAAAKDPMPATAAGQLRNCSVLTWVDLTKWRVVASDQSKRLATTSLVAVSPSGRKAVACELEPFVPGGSAINQGDSQFIILGSYTASDPVLTPAKGTKHAELFAAAGGGAYCPAKKCTNNYRYTGWGRVASNATKVRLQLGPDVHDVAVTDGWFAFTYVGSADQSVVKNSPKLTAYDKFGKVVRTIDY